MHFLTYAYKIENNYFKWPNTDHQNNGSNILVSNFFFMRIKSHKCSTHCFNGILEYPYYLLHIYLSPFFFCSMQQAIFMKLVFLITGFRVLAFVWSLNQKYWFLIKCFRYIIGIKFTIPSAYFMAFKNIFLFFTSTLFFFLYLFKESVLNYS